MFHVASLIRVFFFLGSKGARPVGGKVRRPINVVHSQLTEKKRTGGGPTVRPQHRRRLVVQVFELGLKLNLLLDEREPRLVRERTRRGEV